jgi:parallel beta-helix repeat protein
MTSKVISFSILILFLFSCRKDDSPAVKKGGYIFTEPKITGNMFYIDPVNGSMDGDGSEHNPWSTLQEVVEHNLIQFYKHTENYNPESALQLVNEDAPVKGGDEILLLSGYHGYLHVNNFVFNNWLTIKAKEGHIPVLSQIKMVGAFKNIYIKNITVIKESYQGSGNYWETETLNSNSSNCIYLGSSDFWGKGSFVKLNKLKVKTAENTESWLAEDWVDKAASGIGLRSVTDIEIVNCQIENVQHGITVEYHSNHSNVVNNLIKGYSGDGARVISDNVLFAYNRIEDCYDVDENHDDGIQSYSRGEDNSAGTGVLYDVILRGNIIIGTTKPTHPLAGYPQGIGCFDGMFDGWIVENNLIVTNHYHGISFYGMLNSKIINNTVVDAYPDDNISPWIMITSHKDETSSENCIAANNIVSSSVSVSGSDVEEFNNFIVGRSEYDMVYQIFVDPDNFDFHLLKNELTEEYIINAGHPFPNQMSTIMDLENIARTSGPDLGAYEY